jgi:hypothetical protein
MTDHPPPLSDDEFVSLLKVDKSDHQSEISRLVALGYAVRRLGELGLTASGVRRSGAGQ